jgi:hypothetical protein
MLFEFVNCVYGFPKDLNFREVGFTLQTNLWYMRIDN